jgi:amino acid transporter
LANAISLGVAVAIFNAMIAIALIGARGVYAAARDRAFPGVISRRLNRVHPTHGSPWVATLLLGVVGLFLCLLPLSTLIMINGNSAGIIYALLAIAVIRGRWTGATSASRSRMILHPVGPVIVILTMLAIIMAGLSHEGSGRTGLLVAAAILCAGGAYYQLVVRHRDDWAHHEPEEDPHLS